MEREWFIEKKNQIWYYYFYVIGKLEWKVIMDNKDFEFDVEDIKEAEDAYDYSDLEDLSLIAPKKKEVRLSKEEEIEAKAENGIKILGIIVGVIVLIIVVAAVVMLLYNNARKNTYAYQYNQGYAAYQEMDYESAIKYFEKALTYDDADNVAERIYLYKCYKTTGEEEKAIQVLLDLLKYDQYNVEAITVVSGYYYKNGDMEKLDALIEKYKGTEAESALSSYMLDVPAVSHDSGKYNGSISVVLYSATGDNIYYTLDGTDPTAYDNLYSAPVEIGKGTTILKAVVINSAGVSSDVVEYKYEIEFVTPDTPEVSPASGNYTENQQIIVSNVPEGAAAYYTLDGSTPTLESEQYTEPIDMPGGNNIFSVVFITNDNVSSAVVKRNYNLKVSEKYSFEASVEAIKYVLIKKQEISSDGMKTADGEEIKFVYYAKREVGGTEMYLMYYDIKQDEGFVRQNYLWGVDVQKGTTYKVVDVNGVLTSEEYK